MMFSVQGEILSKSKLTNFYCKANVLSVPRLSEEK